jgi:hypothetical protein
MEHKATGPRRLFLRKLLVVTVSIFVALVVVELSLRFVRFSEPSLFYVYDHDRGIALRPLAEGWWHNENENYVRINSWGFHDLEHTRTKQSGTLRIAVLGDSYAEALQVPLEDAFWAETERRLQQCPNIGGRKVEVLNFGVSGYGTAQELITLRERVWDYSPDIVLLTFTAGNDLNDNLKQLSNNTMRPYFVYRDGTLTLDRSTLDSREASRRFRLRNSTVGRALDWLRQHLRAVQLVSSLDRAVAAESLAKPEPSGGSREDESAPKQTSQSQMTNSNSGGPMSGEPGLDDMVYHEPVNETWKEAWRVTEGLISQMHDEAKSRGATFYLVTLSNEAQVPPNAGDYEKTLQSLGVKDLFYPERRIRALGERERFPVLNLAPLLKDYAEKHAVYLHGFGERRGSGHWNQAGHRAAGEMIAGWLCAESTR